MSGEESAAFASIVPHLSVPLRPSALLADFQIREATEGIGLLGGDYNPAAARYATYELHASPYVERLHVIGGHTGYVDHPIDGDEIVVGPRTTIRVFSAESINLPADVFADVTALGQLFAAGLCAGNTYVDPGSTGPIYIAMTNHQDRAIRIPVGSPMARVLFHVLGHTVATTHGGPETRRPIFFKVDNVAGGAGAGRASADDVGAEIRQRLEVLESREQRQRGAIRARAVQVSSRVRRVLAIFAGLVFVAGVLALTPLSSNSPTLVRVALIVGAGLAAALAIGRTFIGGSVREWLNSAEARAVLALERRGLRRAGLDDLELASARTPDPADQR